MRLWIFCLAALASVIAIGLWYASVITANRAPLPQDDVAAAPWFNQALASNRAMSRAREKRIRAAPSPHRSFDQSKSLPEDKQRAGQRPPHGYTLTDVTEMTVAALPPRPPAAAKPPPRHSWLDPDIAITTLPRQAAVAGRDWTFAWIERAPGVSLAVLRDVLGPLNVAVLGASGPYTRIRVPAVRSVLRAIATLPEVVGLGGVPTENKADADFASKIVADSALAAIPVFVTLMDNDPDGRWRRELERLGLVVGAWDEDLRSYSANLPPNSLDAVLAADYALAVEPVLPVSTTHDTAVPVMGADAVRRLDPSTGLFGPIAGQAVPIGVMDTGLNVRHPDLGSGRDSICGMNFIAEEDYDLWLDLRRHGTHVTGTIAGNGTLDATLSGMAPGVSHIRFAKVLSSHGSGSTAGINQGMDYLAKASRCSRSGGISERAKPLLVNMSLSASGLSFSGRGVGERKLDATVWANDQLYVVAQANAGVHGFSNYGTAKNSLAVGAVADTATIASFSSHGPTADGRLAPNLVGTGVNLKSARGSGQKAGYDSFNGTSMAAPSVAGVAALLMDAAPRFRGQPALARARLMASAVKPDAHLRSGGIAKDNSAGPQSFQRQYGLGLASARLSVLQRNQPDGWTTGAAVSELRDGQYAYVDIDVPEGASRLDLVMTWDEAPADAITESVLNDLDLWLDLGSDCPSPACGEHSSRSRVDNVEWILVPQPPPGKHRVKILAEHIHGEAPRAAVAWKVIRGASTPQLRVEPASGAIAVQHGETIELELLVTVSEYVASAVTLHLGHRGSRRNYKVRIDREDGTTRSVRLASDDVVRLGEIGAGEAQRVTFSYPSSQNHRLYFTATAWNAIGATAQVDVQVGGSDFFPHDRAVPPANDRFAQAMSISGSSGEHFVDLMLATREPGEPEVERNLRLKQRFSEVEAAEAFAKSRSVWFGWRAPATGQFTFRYGGSSNVFDFTMAVFAGDELAALNEIGGVQDTSIAFNAQRGGQYWIRVATTGYATRELRLSWDGGQGRPPNDDFAARHPIEGSEGATEGSNLGASLERGEFFGDRAATVWYEWTAPEDGQWTFRTTNGDLQAFTGERLAALRLVSSLYDYRGYATVVAAAGERYQLAVATRNIDMAGGAFSLRWRPSNAREIARMSANDHFSAAAILTGATGSAAALQAEASTVEPREPRQTGTQTEWWRWRSPATGPYTFHLSGRDANLFEVHLFFGDELAELQWLGGAGEVVLDAERDRTYSIAIGKRYDSTFELISRDLRMGWGETPPNDHPAGALSLRGTSGSVTASHEFATTSVQGSTAVAGHSSLWWTWTAPRPGWYRFWIEQQAERELDGEGVLALHRINDDDSRTLLTTTDRSYVLNGAAETAVLAGAGDQYLVQAAPRVWRPAGPFRFAWESASAPDWLLYRGQLVDGDRLPGGGVLALHEPRSLALDDAGRRLFVATAEALLLFNRDRSSGELSLDQSVTYHDRSGNTLSWLAGARLQWVSEQGLLYGFSRDRAALFRLSGAGEGFVEECAIETVPGVLRRTLARTLSVGQFLYLVGREDGIATYRLEAPCEFALVQALSNDAHDHPSAEQVAELSDIVDATLGPDGNHVHVAQELAATTFRRNPQSGTLRLTATTRDGDYADSGVPVQFPTNASGVTSMAMDPSGSRLFIFGQRGPQTLVFGLDRPDTPSFLSYTSHFYMDRLGFPTHFDYPVTGWVHSPFPCTSSTPRGGDAVDVVCEDSAYVAKWDSARRELIASDWFSLSAPDRFGNEIPQFGNPVQAVQSPDGSHLYVITGDLPYALLTFQRAGSIPLP